MQALILGDVHLGRSTSMGRSGVGSNLNSRIVDQLSLLDWTLDYATDHSIENIIITGDIFEDPKPSSTLITLFISWLNRCSVHGINVHIIAGNHDIIRHGTVLSSPLDIIVEIDSDNVSIYKNIDSITIGSTAFTLVPFRDRKSSGCSSNVDAVQQLRESIVYELAGVPETYKKVLIGHLAIEGSIPVGDEIDDQANELFCPISMFQGYDYVWMGHVHKPQQMGSKASHIYHIGSMDISNFLEVGQKKHIVVYCCNTGKFSTVQLPTRPLGQFSITVPKDTKDSTQYIIDYIENSKTDLANAIIKVDISVSGDTPSVKKSTISKAIIDAGAFNVTRISESRQSNIVKKDDNSLEVQMNVPDSIKLYAEKYVDEKKRSAYLELALEIHTNFQLEAKS